MYGWVFFTPTNMDVSKNRDTPKSSILIGFSIVNHPFWDATIWIFRIVVDFSVTENSGCRAANWSFPWYNIWGAACRSATKTIRIITYRSTLSTSTTSFSTRTSNSSTGRGRRVDDFHLQYCFTVLGPKSGSPLQNMTQATKTPDAVEAATSALNSSLMARNCVASQT